MTQNSFVLTIAWSFISIKCSFVLVICWFTYILHANRQQIYFKYRAIGLLSFQLFLATAWICLGIISYLDKYLGLFTNYSWFSSTILSVCGHVTLTGIINTLTMRLFYFVIQIELMQDANSRLVIQKSILYHRYNMNNNCKQQCDHKPCTHSCTLSTSTTIRTKSSRQLEESQALAAAKDYNTNGTLFDGDVKNSNCNNGHMHMGVDINQIVNCVYDKQTNMVDYNQARVYTYSERNDRSHKDNSNHNKIDGLLTTKLISFFEPQFAKSTSKKQQKIHRKEFTMFASLCVRSLCMENLLFWVNCVQLLKFLIEYKYIDVNMDDQNKLQSLVFPLKLNFKTRHLMKQTDLISRLETNYRIMIKNAKHNDDDGNDDTAQANVDRYEIFERYYCELFFMFLKTNSAPFELNIRAFMKEKFQNHYNFINQRQNSVMTKKLFFNCIWYDIKLAGITTFRLLDATFGRFMKNYGVKTAARAHDPNKIMILSVRAPQFAQSDAESTDEEK